MAAIVIPAHNEATVIGRTLQSVLAQKREGDEVYVVANGCTDGTEDVVRAFGAEVTLLTTPIASKSRALNAGDRHAVSFPRIYLDADVVMAPGALVRIEQALASGRWAAVSTDPCMDTTLASWAVKAYYRIWLSLPYCRNGMIGAGLYAVSEAGRGRYAHLPDLIADDGYVRAVFAEHERGKVENACSIIRAPGSLRWLVKIKTRSRMGRIQLAPAFPDLVRNERKAYGAGLRAVLRNPLRWPAAAVYLYVALLSRCLAHWRLRRFAEPGWERDLSSR